MTLQDENALLTQARPVGSAFGIGRFGTIIGPLFGGMVISLALPIGDAFLIGAAPAAISSVALIVLALVMRPAASRRAAEVVVETYRAS